MRAAALLALAACGHATAPVAPPPRSPATAPVALVTDVVSPDDELASILPSHDPKYAPVPPATALARSALPAGPVPRAPALVVTRVPDVDRCGGEDVIVTIVHDPRLPALDPSFALAMTIPTPTLATLSDLRLWLVLASARATPALDAAKQRAKTSTGQFRVEAGAQAVLIQRHYADALLHVRRPVVSAITASGFPAFCDAIARQLSPQIHAADDAARTCREDIVKARVGPGWWDAVCIAP